MRNGKPRIAQRIKVERSCGNVFADMGLENAEQLLLHAKLVSRLDDIIEDRGLTRRRAAKVLGIKQSDLSKLLGGDLERFPTDALFRFLNSLDQNVDIVIRPKGTGDREACTDVVGVK